MSACCLLYCTPCERGKRATQAELCVAPSCVRVKDGPILYSALEVKVLFSLLIVCLICVCNACRQHILCAWLESGAHSSKQQGS